MLLVWQGIKPGKRWIVSGHIVGLGELASALKHFWQSIAYEFPGVEAIEMVVIDLTKREQISDS